MSSRFELPRLRLPRLSISPSNNTISSGQKLLRVLLFWIWISFLPIQSAQAQWSPGSQLLNVLFARIQANYIVGARKKDEQLTREWKEPSPAQTAQMSQSNWDIDKQSSTWDNEGSHKLKENK